MSVDREKVCPLLLRCFWKDGRGNIAVDYKDSGHGKVPQNEIQIYTWPDATLREIADLVKDVIVQSLQQRQLTLTFALVYPDREGRFVLRSVGKVAAFQGGADDGNTLADIQFQTGDYLDILVETGKSNNGHGGGARADNGRCGGRGGGVHSGNKGRGGGRTANSNRR